MLGAGIACAMLWPAQAAWAAGAAQVTSASNRVEVSSGGTGWSAASVGQELQVGDRLKTGEDSRATVRMTDGSVLQLDELTTIEIKPPKEANAEATLSIPGGATFFSNGGRGREVRIETPSANGAIRGTAFLLTVNRAGGQSEVSMIEGAFEMSNGGGGVVARQNEQARTTGATGPKKDVYGDTGDTAPWYLVLETRAPGARALSGVEKPAFLKALYDTIKRYRHVAPQLSGGATLVRREWALEILEEAFRAVGPDCEMRARILRSIIAAAPEQAAELTELAIALGPGCAGAFGSGGAGGDSSRDGFGSVPNQNILPPPGSIGGGGGQGNVVAICHNGLTIFVSPQGAVEHLRNHAGDTPGPCQVTPVTNR